MAKTKIGLASGAVVFVDEGIGIVNKHVADGSERFVTFTNDGRRVMIDPSTVVALRELAETETGETKVRQPTGGRPESAGVEGMQF